MLDGSSPSRAELLRRRHRRIFRWSFAIAVAAHGVAFVYVAWLRPTPTIPVGMELLEGEVSNWGGTPVRVFFDSPLIAGPEGDMLREGPGRGLSAERRLTLGPECWSDSAARDEGASGEVFLVVNELGRVDSVRVTRSSGSVCWDRALSAVASDLWYRWLPNDRVPAPVEVLQPVTVSLADF